MIWRPTDEVVAGTNLARFIEHLEQTRGLRFEPREYEELWRWSVTELEGFWRAVWEHFDVQADGDPATVLGDRDDAGRALVPGRALNHAEHVFRGRNGLGTSRSSPPASAASRTRSHGASCAR